MTTDLPTLIRDIKAGPVTRELNDRVLRACCELYASEDGDHFYRKHGTEKWIKDDGYGAGLTPLTNLQDATLADLPGWIHFVTEEYPDGLTNIDVTYPELGQLHVQANCPRKARVLAGLKAREREAEDG